MAAAARHLLSAVGIFLSFFGAWGEKFRRRCVIKSEITRAHRYIAAAAANFEAGAGERRKLKIFPKI